MQVQPQEVNNSIVKLRKVARQAKVHVIHKLSRKIKELRKPKKGKEVVDERFAKRADKLAEELLLIKKLDPDFVTKSILLAEKSPEQILADRSTSKQQRAVARLGINKQLSDAIRELKTRYDKINLKEHVSLEKKTKTGKTDDGKKSKGKAKKTKETSLTGENAIVLGTKRTLIGESDDVDGSNDVKVRRKRKKDYVQAVEVVEKVEKMEEESDENSETESDKPEESSEDSPSDADVKNEEKIEKPTETPLKNTVKPLKNTVKPLKNTVKPLKNTVKIPAKNPEKFPRRNNQAVIKPVSELFNENPPENQPIPDLDDPQMEATSTDAFFLTKSGANKKVVIPLKMDNPVHVQNVYEDGLNRKMRRGVTSGKKMAKKNARSDGFINNGKLNGNVRNKGLVREKEREVVKEINDLEDLHPSWKAKKLQKPQITEFVGKKIVFDD